ncbi:MAG: type IV secretion system protein VirB8 [Rickettsiales bacterium]|jgi:type IV secretion system protein VirB8
MDKSTDLEKEEYNKFIKASVYDGSFFGDAKAWYLFRYVQPVCHRTILFFMVLIIGFVTYVLVMTIQSSFPIKEKVGISIRPKDQSRYFPVIKSLKDSIEVSGVDEAVLKYLLIKYVEKRENYDLRETDIQALNDQMNYIKNNSSLKEYRNFQSFLSKKNPNSPIIYFGRDYQRIVDIGLVLFPKEKDVGFISRAKNFVVRDIPNRADIYHTITIKANSKTKSTQKYLAKINFKFSGVDADLPPGSRLDFMITSYKIYKIK